jgi:hypothetical protein
MTKSKKVNQIIKKFLCCIPSNIIKHTANTAVGQNTPWTAALAIWTPYQVYIYCGLKYFIRLQITSISNCNPTVIFDSVLDSTDTWAYYTYKMKDVNINNTGNIYGCCKGQSVCVSLGIKVDGCGNPVPGNTA